MHDVGWINSSMLFFLLLVGFAATPAAAEPLYVRQVKTWVTAKDWGIEGKKRAGTG